MFSRSPVISGGSTLLESRFPYYRKLLIALNLQTFLETHLFDQSFHRCRVCESPLSRVDHIRMLRHQLHDMTDWMIEWLIEKLLSLHVTGTLPLRDELLCRTARFITSCLNCENTAVQFVSRHGVYFGRAGSAFGLNAQLCSAQFDMPLSRLCSSNTKCVWRYITLEENVYTLLQLELSIIFCW